MLVFLFYSQRDSLDVIFEELGNNYMLEALYELTLNEEILHAYIKELFSRCAVRLYRCDTDKEMTGYEEVQKELKVIVKYMNVKNGIVLIKNTNGGNQPLRNKYNDVNKLGLEMRELVLLVHSLSVFCGKPMYESPNEIDDFKVQYVRKGE